MKIHILGCVLLLCFICPVALAQTQMTNLFSSEEKALGELQGVILNVTLGSADATPEDPTESEMREIIESRLRSAGMKVINSNESNSKQFPTLNVHIDFRNENEEVYTLVVDVELIEEVILQRRSGIKVEAITWSRLKNAYIGSGNNNKRREIETPINSFICSFSRANPKAKAAAAACHLEFP